MCRVCVWAVWGVRGLGGGRGRGLCRGGGGVWAVCVGVGCLGGAWAVWGGVWAVWGPVGVWAVGGHMGWGAGGMGCVWAWAVWGSGGEGGPTRSCGAQRVQQLAIPQASKVQFMGVPSPALLWSASTSAMGCNGTPDNTLVHTTSTRRGIQPQDRGYDLKPQPQMNIQRKKQANIPRAHCTAGGRTPPHGVGTCAHRRRTVLGDAARQSG